MQILFFLFLWAPMPHSFFLQNKDLRKILRSLPKVFEIEAKTPPLNHKRRDPDYHHNDDGYDKYDHVGSRRTYTRKSNVRNIQDILRDKPHYCDHHHHKPADEHHRNKPSEYIHKDDQENKKVYEARDDEKIPHKDREDKDYVRGIVVAIPRIKSHDLEAYFQDNKQQNILLQHFLKTDDSEDHHHFSEDGSYFY